MKFLQSRFEEYIAANEKYNLHAELEGIYNYKTPNLKTKINLLSHLLNDDAFNKVIIFARTKENANNVFKFLERKLVDKVRIIHGNKGQNSRINAFNDFRNDKVRVLVTTDVSARGLDINMVSHVINFDVPRVYEEYVHRIGRTGRAEQSGIAISFVNEVEEIHMKEIEKIISENIEKRSLPKDVALPPTGKEELKEIALEIDKIKRAKNPEFKGAFHEKKKKIKPAKPKTRNKRKRRR